MLIICSQTAIEGPVVLSSTVLVRVRDVLALYIYNSKPGKVRLGYVMLGYVKIVFLKNGRNKRYSFPVLP